MKIFYKEKNKNKSFSASPIYDSPMLPNSGHYYDDQAYENYRQHYAQISSDNYQQQQNEQQLLMLSLGTNK